MEQKYWEQFMKTGGVTDYLGYKMEVYGHCQRENEAEKSRSRQGESDYGDRYGAADSAGWRI